MSACLGKCAPGSNCPICDDAPLFPTEEFWPLGGLKGPSCICTIERLEPKCQAHGIKGAKK